MIHIYQGHFLYNNPNINGLNSNEVGVYYCGYIAQSGNLIPLYIGKATGQEGIRGRLLQHLSQDNWSDVTHFGYCICDTKIETDNLEGSEINCYKPKYNSQGK